MDLIKRSVARLRGRFEIIVRRAAHRAAPWPPSDQAPTKYEPGGQPQDCEGARN